MSLSLIFPWCSTERSGFLWFVSVKLVGCLTLLVCLVSARLVVFRHGKICVKEEMLGMWPTRAETQRHHNGWDHQVAVHPMRGECHR